MEAFTSDKECMYYMKLLIFTLGIGMDVLHNYFEQKILNAMDFYLFLEKYKHNLFHECFPKVQCCECSQNLIVSSSKSGGLNKSQFQLLFDILPPTEKDHYKTGRHNEILMDCLCRIDAKRSNEVDCMDITLMCAVITSCFINQKTPIHGNPRHLDTVKQTRNFLAHSPDIRISEDDFKRLWAETEQAILGIASAVGNYFAKANKRKIDDFKGKELSMENIKGIAESNPDDVMKNLLDQIENHRKTELEKKVEELTKYCDELSIDIGNLRFDVKQHASQTPISFQEETLYSRGRVLKKDTIACVSDVQVTREDTNVKKCRVEWKLETPDTWNLTEIKDTLMNFSQLLRKWFEIEFVYIGSLVIKTLVQKQVLENRDQMRTSIHSFLVKMVEVCNINTDVLAVIKVTLKIDTDECGYKDLDADDTRELPKAETMDNTIASMKQISQLSIDDSALEYSSKALEVQDAVINTSSKAAFLPVFGRTFDSEQDTDNSGIHLGVAQRSLMGTSVDQNPEEVIKKDIKQKEKDVLDWMNVNPNDESEMTLQIKFVESSEEDELDILDVNIVSKDDNERSSSDDSAVSGMTQSTTKTDETAKSRNIEDGDTEMEDIPRPSSYLKSCLKYINDSLNHLEVKNFVEAKKLCLRAYDIISYIVDGDTESNLIDLYQKCSQIFFKCEDHWFALECYYKGFWIRKLDKYSVHACDVLMYWLPLLEGLNHMNLITLIRKVRVETDKQLATNPTENCEKALYIYLDLNLSQKNVQGDFQAAKVVMEDVRCILVQMARCYLLLGNDEQVCKICTEVNTKFPVTKGNALVCDFFQTWVTALQNLRKLDVARNLDSYRSTNEQQQSAETAEKKQEHFIDCHSVTIKSESQDFINVTWIDVKKIENDMQCHLTASSTDIKTPEESEQPLPEEHDITVSNDTMSVCDLLAPSESSSGNGYDSEYCSSSDDLEDLYNFGQFEQSSPNCYTEFNELDVEDILIKGISLSFKFIEEYIEPSYSQFTFPAFYSNEKNEELCRHNPLKFKKCKVRKVSSDGAVCTNLDHSDDIQEIEISGRSKIGKVFNEDEVYVEVLQDERDAYKNKNYVPRLQKTLDLSKMSWKVFGQIRGVKQRHQYPDIDHPVFVCVLDESEFHHMLPISKIVPKIHISNRKCQNKYQVDVYRYVEEKGYLVHKELFNIKPGDEKNYIFLVAMIHWEGLYPLGSVIKVINTKDDFSSGMEILRLKNQVPTLYRSETVKNVLTLSDQWHKLVKWEEREDLTDLEVFTIDPTDSRDLDDALSIENTSEGNYRIGVHIADVTAIIKKGDYIDCEAYNRATTFYPGQGGNPYHMLPEPLSIDICSLIPGQSRPVISIFFTFDKEGNPLAKHEIKRSVIRSRQKLTYHEAQDVLLNIGRHFSDSICKAIKILFIIAKSRRTRRLGGAMYHVPTETDNDDFMETKEAHFLVEEFMILANHTIGTYLFSKFKNCVPLRIQPPPEPECIQQWLKSNEYIADLILKLQEVSPLPVIESERKLSVNNARPGKYNSILMFQQHVWKSLVQAIHDKDFRTVMRIIGCDEIHPFACLGLEEWYEYQEKAEYKCSGDIKSKKDGSHFSLGIFPYIHFTSPIRRYVDIISHRLLHCALDEKKPCYTPEEISEMCHHINEVTRRAKNHQNNCRAFTLAYRFKTKPTVLHGFVKTISEREITVVIPGYRNLPKESCTLQLNSLGCGKTPVFKTNYTNGREMIELYWKKRLYSFNGFAPVTQKHNSKIYRVNPHHRAFFQQQIKWLQLLQVVIDETNSRGKMSTLGQVLFHSDFAHPEFNLEQYIPECYGTEKDISSEVRKGTITLQSCEYSMTFSHGQVLALQMSAESIDGVLIPKIEMFDMTKNVKYCLLHMKDPIKYLEQYSINSTKDFYYTSEDYIRTWKPLVEMEAATNAINMSTATINDVPVKFLSQMKGKFSLEKAFLEQRNIEINKVPIEVYLNPENKKGDDEEEGIREIASPDYLCIKSVVNKSGVEAIEFGHTHSCAPHDYKIWHGHAKIDKVNVKSERGKIDFFFKLHKNSQQVPHEFMKDGIKPRCGIEVLFKSSADCRTDAILQCLDKANSLQTAIALGKKIPNLDKGHFEIGREIEPDILEIKGIVRNNPQQYQAIQKALESSFSLIQGPPGTGKTFTGIKLVYLFNKINLKWHERGNDKKQIMFCGPSNESLDLVAKWMKKKLGERCPKMVRWYESSIEGQEFPIPGKTSTIGGGKGTKADEQLREYSMHILIRQLGKPYQQEISAFDIHFRRHPGGVDFNDVKKYRKLIRKAVIEEVAHYDVIFCTTALATHLKVMAGIKGRIFQIIVDECEMCTEPESMAAIIATRAQQVVLIGDHKQLRPIVMSSNAAKLGLETSLFERYAEKGKMLTMLTSQYRMHPEICAFPSKQFYRSRIETMPSFMWRTDSPLKSWIKQNTPVIFCHVEGTEEYLPFTTEEGNKQSFSNKEEVDQVVKVFNHLVEDELIDTHFINIMSQYNSQCHSIRQELKKERFIQFNVNTVVASQGGEWDYVVLSLVRSLPDYRIEPKPTLGWCKQNLGLITDEHQTNVALTRARKGLIVIGNQKLLKCNDVWANFLNHYGQRGCVVDCDNFPPPQQRIQERKQRRKKSRRVQEMNQ